MWLWSALSPVKLSAEAASTIQDCSSDIVVSAVSLWQVSLKYSLGKLNLSIYDPSVLSQKLTDDLDVVHLPISADDANTVHELKAIHHRDPFDRLLIWQAIRGGYTLITKDKQIWRYEDVGLKWLW